MAGDAGCASLNRAMPEGDAVRRAAIRLDAALAGGTLLVAEVRVPRFAAVDLRGATVAGTATVGKHLLTRMVHRGRKITLHSHMRMDGRWVTGFICEPCGIEGAEDITHFGSWRHYLQQGNSAAK